MISTLKNIHGYVQGYIEWEIVDRNGQFDSNGDYIYVQNCWLHEHYRFTSFLAQLADKIYEHPYSQKATRVYWDVSKNKDGKMLEENDDGVKRLSKQHIYHKDTIIKKLRSSYEYITDIVSLQV